MSLLVPEQMGASAVPSPHAYGFFPMWILWCKTIFELRLKNLLHSLHLYGLARVNFLVLHEAGTAKEGFATLTAHIG